MNVHSYFSPIFVKIGETMSSNDKRIDAYIAKSASFAQPILLHLRELIHQACPDVEETIKWGFPHFDYKGPFCSMASFKNHCAFTFWKGSLLNDPDNILDKNREESMGQFGKLTSLADLPSDKIIKGFIRQAMRLNEEGIKLPQKQKPAEKKELDVPEWFLEALRTNKKAFETFNNFSYSNKKEYVEWVTGAQQEETRNKRLKTTIEWLSEGKTRNWKYQR
jgi:uncharacterized protein YdeI (YjbR/CyaY-like superfamily)